METTHVIRDAAGEYLTPGGSWSPASNEAAEYDDPNDAESALIGCRRATARILTREIE